MVPPGRGRIIMQTTMAPSSLTRSEITSRSSATRLCEEVLAVDLRGLHVSILLCQKRRVSGVQGRIFSL